MERTKIRNAARNAVLVGLMVAVIEVSKIALSTLMNIELVTFWFMIFTLVFGRLVLFTVPVFLVIEAVIYPMGSWFLMYLYIWPLVVLTAFLFRKRASVLSFSIISSLFGFTFGALGLPVHMLFYGPEAGFAWWVAGIPADITHGTANFIFMLLLFKPVTKAFKTLK